MRFGLKAKETLVITLLSFLVVATTSSLHLSQLARVTVLESLRQGDLMARQIYAQGSRALARGQGGTPWEILKRDPELRSLIEASVGYSPELVYVFLADQTGRAILHSQPDKEGTEIPPRPTLDKLLGYDALNRFWALYSGDAVYEATLPLNLNGRPFGSVRLGFSTSLLRRELNSSLQRGFVLAGLSLPLAWLVAMVLANLTLKPIRKFTRQMERMRQGEFEVSSDLAQGDEFKELASELQLLGQQLQSDRLKMLGERIDLHQVVDQLEDGLIFFNQERRILFINKAAETVLGKGVEGVVGRPLEEVLESSHPLRMLMERVFSQSVGSRNVTITLPRNGKSREFLVSAFSVRDVHKTMGAMVLLKDLDSLKTLQSLVSYSAKLTALGRLTSGVAHEVKNPLNAMMIHLELLKEKLGSSSEGVQENLEVIGNEIRRLDRALQGFLKFIRPQELALKPVELNTLLQSLLALLEVEWQKAGVRFVFRPESPLPTITADEELLRQAFLNLLLNACQAMPKGGAIQIVTERETPEAVRVTIVDEGVGISPDDLDKIFALYYTTKPDGSGIGLSLVYRIVQLHDGIIDVSSEVGRGTTMSVRLPVG
ncbi:MAG TPA: ATP-binding protein [Candidatus Methylomirabilis sp.]|nr:ATP-binding protein [Candidatus Methylomirabilis sp.]